jgi:hypothetical protein
MVDFLAGDENEVTAILHTDTGINGGARCVRQTWIGSPPRIR